MTVFATCRDLVRHPIRQLVHQWNWKNAVFTALVRGAVFFATNLVAGVPAAVRAFAVDALFRVPLSGFYAAITQALRSAQPRWAVLMVIGVAIPTFGHTVEFLVHWLFDTPELRQNAYVKGRSVFLRGRLEREAWRGENAERRRKITDGLTAAYFLLSAEPTPWHLIAGFKPADVVASLPAQWKAWALAQTQVRYKAS